MPLVGDNEWLQSAAGGQKTTAGAAPDFVILIALCGLNCFIVPNKQAKNDKWKVLEIPKNAKWEPFIGNFTLSPRSPG